MNCYHLKEKDLVKKKEEFSKTPFGHRAKIFSAFPFFVSIFCGFFYIFFMCLNYLDIEENYYVICNMYFLGLIISFVVGCITNLQYGNMLKEYINSSK